MKAVMHGCEGMEIRLPCLRVGNDFISSPPSIGVTLKPANRLTLKEWCEYYVPDFDFQIKRPSALAAIMGESWRFRQACNFRVFRERRSLFHLWLHAEHFYRDVSPETLANESAEELAT